MIKPIKKSIEINASAEKVWNSLFTTESYKVWAAPFSSGSTVRTDWNEGSEVVFVDDTNSGLAGRITKSTKPTFLCIKYDAEVKEGKIDAESEMSQQVKGTEETYTLTESHGVTKLDISLAMDEIYFDMMSAMWDKALMLVKELAEK